MDYDVFVSHASEDKTRFVDHLCKALIEEGIRVWYDKHAIKYGDSIKSSILDGIKSSKYTILVISSNFFKKQWTSK